MLLPEETVLFKRGVGGGVGRVELCDLCIFQAVGFTDYKNQSAETCSYL